MKEGQVAEKIPALAPVQDSPGGPVERLIPDLNSPVHKRYRPRSRDFLYQRQRSQIYQTPLLRVVPALTDS